MNCPNCNAALTCGCQKRTSANGKQCCSNCITSCNQNAGMPNQQQPRPSITPRGPYTPHP
jgi:hypothetical protein